MINIPAKTFLLGEYLALKGGPSLIALTKPCFTIDASKRLHPDCIAARFWQAKTATLLPFGLKDPYDGVGGMGASSAEYLLAYHAYYGDFKDLEKLHQEYLQYAINPGQKPSGYDVLAQTQQGISLIQQPNKHCLHFDWVFKELGFVLVHTGKKLPTHLHLQSSTQDFDWKKIAAATELGIDAISGNNVDKWLAAILSFQTELQKHHLLAPHSQALIENWQQQWPILAAKGCGAMGADVIALFLEKHNIDHVFSELSLKGFKMLATHQDLYFENTTK
jgi:mevalonate kinase